MKTKKLWQYCLPLIMILCLLIAGNAFAEMDRSEEIDKYRSMLQSTSLHQRITAAKKLTTSGISDEKLFDLISSILLGRYLDDLTDPQQIDEMSWMCKALASSGLTKYRESLKTVANGTSNRKLKGYALQSLGLLDKYAEQNRVISDNKYLSEGFSDEEARYMNMLESKDLTLIRNAAKTIFRAGLLDERVYEVVHQVLVRENGKMPKEKEYDDYGEEVEYGFSRKAKLKIDTISWLCKALGASGQLKYKKTLDEIAKTSVDDRISKYARNSFNMLR